MMSRFWPMFRKEFIQMRRDRLTLAILIGLPIAQLLLFGFAIQTDVRHLPTVVLDESRTPESRDVIAAFQNTGNFRIIAHLADRPALDHALARGDAQAGIIVPYDYPRRLGRGTTATIQIIVDAADPLASQAAINAAAGVAQVRNLAILSLAAGRPRLSVPIEARVRPRYNPGLRSPNYIVPGLVGVILTITMVLITSMAIVRERERGTLEQLIVTPITKTELMLGKIAPYVGVGLIQMTAVLVLGRFVFDVPLSGDVLLLYAIALIFVVASLSFGLFISTLVRTQQQAMQVSFFFVLPNILLSGFMFPRQAMPEVFQWAGLVLPLTHFLKVLRGILLKGVGLEALWREVVVLTGFALVMIVASVRRFRKTLD
jgi:ABC-2 type transport system permease protein